MPNATCGRGNAIHVQLSHDAVKRNTISILLGCFSEYLSLNIHQFNMIMNDLVVHLGKYPTPTIWNFGDWYFTVKSLINAASRGTIHDLFALHFSYEC